MQLVNKSAINREKWDALVNNTTNATIYNQSVFLDVLAENWLLLVNDDYSAGIPIPYTIRLGVKGMYTPNFCREFCFLGVDKLTNSDLKQSLELLKKEFSYCTINLSDNYFDEPVSERVYQTLSGNPILNSQAKRSLKKYEKSDLYIERTELKNVLSIISDELSSKVKSLKPIDLLRFEQLIQSIPTQQLFILGVKNNHEWLGGMVFTLWKNKLHYLKGGCVELAKQEGAMFAMMQYAIDHTWHNDLLMDFGGSNVEGVQRFNKAFGAMDLTYFEWSWNNTPLWFSSLIKLKKLLKK